MRVFPISQNNIYFHANYRKVKNPNDDSFYMMTTTYFFRADTDWDYLGDYLCEKYKDTDKVNVICHACSHGAEPYSFLMHMAAFHPLEFNKFTPVVAKDIDAENIEMAKKSEYEYEDIAESDGNLDYFTKGLYKYFMQPLDNGDMKMTKKFRDAVKFEQGNIFDDISSMPRKNTVLFCKNMWPYLSVEERHRLAKELSEHFDESCVLIIGSYDTSQLEMQELLEQYGFKQNPNDMFIYEKRKAGCPYNVYHNQNIIQEPSKHIPLSIDDIFK